MKEQDTEKNYALYETNWTTDATELLLDLKCLLKEYYVATFTNDGNSLRVSFKNGQTFIISITACPSSCDQTK